MSITRTVTLNAVLEYPTDAEELDTSRRQGENLEADNGGLTVVITGTKRRWKLSWARPKPEIVARLRALLSLETIAFTDPDGASYTVVIPVSGLRWRASHGDAASVALTGYTLELELWER